MKCKKCKHELDVCLEKSYMIASILFVICPKCGHENLDIEITNKITEERLYWENDKSRKA